MLEPKDFFDLEQLDPVAAGLFAGLERVWEALARLQSYLEQWLAGQAAILGHVEAGATLVKPEQIYLGPGARVQAGAYLTGPAYIGPDSEVRHGAYIRGSLLAGAGCVLGHASEFKNAILLPGSAAGHFAYVGDSILGRHVNLGAGTKLANFEMFSEDHKAKTGRRPTIKLPIPGQPTPVDTGLTKLGAILGDEAQTGCNVVTNPGCLIGRGSLVYAGVSLRKGYYGPNQIFKLRQELKTVSRERVGG
jgi:NDP-sugar pyrophosphorylase family protein